jgi:hypothetical protein
MGDLRIAYRVIIRKRERRRRLGRRQINVKTDLKEIECGCVDWIHLAWDRDQIMSLLAVGHLHRKFKRNFKSEKQFNQSYPIAAYEYKYIQWNLRCRT